MNERKSGLEQNTKNRFDWLKFNLLKYDWLMYGLSVNPKKERKKREDIFENFLNTFYAFFYKEKRIKNICQKKKEK